ncbi:hypothetical protein B6U83_02595 [Thermoplasmatales archaeon ex4484_36]|nr:MAG: hypothetical protein B6U83_02595 [Thermoplasmatales archaeon ex4484_36]
MAGRTARPAEQKLSLNDFYVIFSGMRGVRREALEAIYGAGYDTVEKLQNATIEELIKIKGVGEKVAEKVIARAKEYGGGRLEEILLTIPRLRRDVVQEIINRYPTELLRLKRPPRRQRPLRLWSSPSKSSPSSSETSPG